MAPDWTSYFESYAHASASGDTEQLAAFYASGFVAAGPASAYGGLNDDKFRAWLGDVKRFNESSGLQRMSVVRTGEQVSVGPHHCLVEVRWGAQFAKTGERVIEFDISYLLQLASPRPLIVAYVSHEDQQEAMRREGLT